ncbi:MAG: hypothetical protein ABEI32_17080 [Halothece sp.]
MKIQRFSIQLGVSLALMAGLLPTQIQSVQAQSEIQDSDNGAGGFDSTVFAPASQPRVNLVIPAVTTNQIVNTSFTILNQLREGNYEFEESLSLNQATPQQNVAIAQRALQQLPIAQAKLQQNLAMVLTNPTEQAKNDWVSLLTKEGIPKAEAVQLIDSIAGIFGEVEKITPSAEEDFQNNISLRNNLAIELVEAVEAYNKLVKQLDNEVLQNPPNSLLAIRSVLFQASQATRQQ